MLAVLTEIVGVVSPVLHNTLPLPTAVKLAVGLAQVRVAELGLMLTVGTAVELNTDALAVATQPLALVRVTE